ncbi:MAG: STAS-like domain-containing protein [Planctomycetes bacterium]|nr:STAS-like domain-containing protein [Planctomycetota bacterium]
MSLTKRRRGLIRQYIINNVDEHPNDITAVTAKKFSLSRQAISLYLKKLIADKIIESTGKKRNITYQLRPIIHSFTIAITPDTAEDTVWREKIRPVLPAIPENVRNICHYGFTEMLNNVVDHSQSKTATLVVEYNSLKARLFVQDKGIGIFNKIQKDFNLEDPRHAILELAKGKLTSDTGKHTGEGIFFTSRMFDSFSILSGDLYFDRSKNEDWLLDTRKYVKGTAVIMEINRNSPSKMQAVFDKFSTIGDGFSRTVVPVELVRYEGESLVSRSQAKRLIYRFDKFKEVILNFQGIKSIGQAFADEVFRVFRNEHPNVRLQWIHTGVNVKKMIRHVLVNKKSGI